MSSMTAWVTRPPALRTTSVSELEPEDDGGIDPVVEAREHEHLGGGRAEPCWVGAAGESVVAVEDG
jgi:hypothetical protein